MTLFHNVYNISEAAEEGLEWRCILLLFFCVRFSLSLFIEFCSADRATVMIFEPGTKTAFVKSMSAWQFTALISI